MKVLTVLSHVTIASMHINSITKGQLISYSHPSQLLHTFRDPPRPSYGQSGPYYPWKVTGRKEVTRRSTIVVFWNVGDNFGRAGGVGEWVNHTHSPKSGKFFIKYIIHCILKFYIVSTRRGGASPSSLHFLYS